LPGVYSSVDGCGFLTDAEADRLAEVLAAFERTLHPKPAPAALDPSRPTLEAFAAVAYGRQVQEPACLDCGDKGTVRLADVWHHCTCAAGKATKAFHDDPPAEAAVRVGKEVRDA
jgi:hypothetical protein